MGVTMKIRTISAIAGALSLLVVVPSTAHAAAKQTVKIYMTGDCADGQAVEGADEDDCELTVNVTPRSAKRSATLEVMYEDSEDGWEELDSGKTKSGRLVFEVLSTDEDGDWLDGIFMYRVVVNKSGANKKVTSKEYKVAYTSAGYASDDEDLMADIEEVTPEEKQFNKKMDESQQNNQKFNPQPQTGNQSQSNGQQPGGNQQGGNQQGGTPPTPPAAGDRAGQFNQVCGSLAISKTICEKTIAAKNGVDAIAALGAEAERFCKQISSMMKLQTTSCKDVMPLLFK